MIRLADYRFSNSSLADGLKNYRQLLTKVDELCGRIEQAFRPHLACRRGCDGCCRHLSLFRVEGAALTLALAELPEPAAEAIRERARRATSDGPCPLLKDAECLLYHARPIICRTHGLPLLGWRDGERFVDYCPKNFQGVRSLPAAAVIDLEKLNVTLSTINHLFVAEVLRGRYPADERISIAQALLMED